MDVHYAAVADQLQPNDRLRRKTDPAINRRIDRDTDLRIMWFRNRPPADLNERLAELDDEWDLERVLSSNGSLLALTGAVFGMPAVKNLVPLLRRLGVRTRSEIERERLALRRLLILGGDD